MERSNLFKLTGLAAAIMFSSGTLAAGGQQTSFQELDQNRDGKLTPSELSQQPDMARQWNEIDKDKSNAIEQSEFSAFQEEQGQGGSQEMASQLPTFEELDHNGDGKLTTSEVKDEAALTAQWTEIDQDDSDTLDRSEFSAFEEQRQQRDLGQQSQDKQQEQSQYGQQQGQQEQQDQQQGMAQQQQQQDAGEMASAELPEFDKLDEDRNGKLTPEEVSDQAVLATNWTEIDEDNSDSLDRSEFSAFEESYRQEQQQTAQQQSGQQQQDTQQQTAQQQSQAQQQTGGQMTHPLYSMSPEELQGQDVMGSQGEKLGTVSKVVSDRSSGRIHVVVSGGGFMGIASRENAFPLDDLQMEQGVLQAPVSKQELEQRGEYTEDAYVEVQPEDRPISEFSAFEEPATQDDSLRSPTEGQGQGDEPRSSEYGQ